MEDVITVYGAAGSGSVSVEATLTLLGLPYRVIEAATWAEEEARARVGGVNPMRQVPTLVLPTGEVMTESAAILLWLADLHPEAGLAPRLTDPRRGAYLRWMSYVSGAIYSLFWIWADPSRLGVAGPGEPALFERLRDRIADCWRMMDEQLTPGRYLLGEELSVLDIYVAVISCFGPSRPRFYQVAPKMAEVVRRVDAEPRLAAFWARRSPLEE
jgi:GST-like protein